MDLVRHTPVTLLDYSRTMEMKEAVSGFTALSQETRLRLMRLLATKGRIGHAGRRDRGRARPRPRRCRSTWRARSRPGLVRSTRQGRHIIYAVRFVGLRELLSFLTETCCAGRPDLCGDLARLLPDDIDEEDHHGARVQCPVPLHAQLGALDHGGGHPPEDRQRQVQRLFGRLGPGARPDAGGDRAARRRSATTSRGCTQVWKEFTGPDAPRMDFVITLCDTLARARLVRISATGPSPPRGPFPIPPNSPARPWSARRCSTSSTA